MPTSPLPIIDGLALVRKVDEGAFGAVYEARTAEGARVAVKTAKPTGLLGPTDALLKQRNELLALSRLSHRSLPALHAAGITACGQHYLAMEYVEGDRLDEWLGRRAAIDTINAISVVVEIADALAYCHGQGIIHLDLKPQNIIIIDPDAPSLKVLDFGLCRNLDEWMLDRRRTAGTLPYMAPECFTDGGIPSGARVDIYALGVIFYQIITGRLPFPGADPDEIIARKRRGELAPMASPAAEHPHIEALVTSMLAPDPASRPASAALLLTHLHKLRQRILCASSPESHQVSPAPSPSLIAALDLPPFVGRAREGASLHEAFDRALGSSGSAHLIWGDAGMGKTRLVAEMVKTLVTPNDETFVLIGRCSRDTEQTPYAPIQQALLQLCRILPRLPEDQQAMLRRMVLPDHAREMSVLADLVPELRATLGCQARTDSTAHPERLVQGLQTLLLALSRIRMVVLVLEDLHWADQATSDALDALAGVAGTSRLLIVGTSRSRSSARDGTPWHRILLAPLDRAEVERLVALLAPSTSATGMHPLSFEQLPLLGLGNPLVVTHLVHELVLQDSSGAALGAPVAALRGDARGRLASESFSALLLQVLGRLDRECLSILDTAAMIEDSFPIALLGVVLERPVAAVEAAIQPAINRKIVQVSQGVFRFSHDTFREHLLRSSGSCDRGLHLAIARALERFMPESVAIGKHYEDAGHFVEAAETYRRASVRAERRHAPRVSGQLLTLAFRNLGRTLGPASTTAERDGLAEIAYELARVAAIVGETGQALACIDECQAKLDVPSPYQALVLDSARARVFYIRGAFVQAMEFSKRCTANVPSPGRAAQRFQTLPLSILGRACCASGSFGRSVQLLRRACDQAREAGELGELSHSLGMLSVALGFTGEHAEAVLAAREAQAMAIRVDDPIRIIGSHFYHAVLGESLFAPARGLESVVSLMELAQRNRISGLYLYVGTIFAGRLQAALGNLASAKILLRNAINMAREFEIGMGVGWAHAYLGDVLIITRDTAAARHHYQAGLAAAVAVGDEYARPMCLLGLVHCDALDRLHIDELAARSREALQGLNDAGNVSTSARAYARLAHVLGAVELEDQARRCDRAARELSARLHLPTGWRRQEVVEVRQRPSLDPSDVLDELRAPIPALLRELSSEENYVPRFVA